MPNLDSVLGHHALHLTLLAAECDNDQHYHCSFSETLMSSMIMVLTWLVRLLQVWPIT